MAQPRDLPLVRCVFFLLLLSSCGDPRTVFIGTWKGPMTTVVRFSNGATESYPKGQVTVVISAPERSDQLTFNGRCAMTATVKDDQTFSINRKACPAERITLDDGTSCDLVETVNGGSGSRGEASLSLSYFGESQVTRCSDGLSGFATYTTEALLSE
jgi:hypothetical protein